MACPPGLVVRSPEASTVAPPQPPIFPVLRLLIIFAWAAPALTWAGDLADMPGVPFAQEAYWAPVVGYPRPGSLHAVFNLDCTDQDVTPHGLILENQGVIVQPLLLFYTPLHADPADWLGNVTFTAGGWGNWHSRPGGKDPGNWREVDIFSGLTCIVERDWQLTSFCSAYLSQTHSYPTAWDCALAVTYDDTRLLGSAAMHPFVEYRPQIHGSTTAVIDPENAGKTYSFRLGIIPQHQFGPLRLEMPAFLTWVPEGFYQDNAGRPAAGGIGFMSAALKLSMPLEYLSTKNTSTTLYAAAQYYRIVNGGLLDTNEVLGTSARREHDILQFHLGIRSAF